MRKHWRSASRERRSVEAGLWNYKHVKQSRAPPNLNQDKSRPVKTQRNDGEYMNTDFFKARAWKAREAAAALSGLPFQIGGDPPKLPNT